MCVRVCVCVCVGGGGGGRETGMSPRVVSDLGQEVFVTCREGGGGENVLEIVRTWKKSTSYNPLVS